MPFSAPSETHGFTFREEFCDWKFGSRLLQGCWDASGAEMMQDVREWGVMWGELDV